MMKWQTSKKQFDPEGRNRLDAVVPFAPLTPPIVARVVDKFLLELEQQLLTKNVEATFAPALRRHLANKGFGSHMGTRPMQRLIRETIRSVLADELLFGRLANGGAVKLDWDDQKGKTVLKFSRKKEVA